MKRNHGLSQGCSYLLEVYFTAIELEMFSALEQTSTVFDDLLQTHSCPFCRSDGAFSPGCVDHLVAFAWIFHDLLDSPRPTALNGDHIGLPWE
jgi:hypothetical protein